MDDEHDNDIPAEPTERIVIAPRGRRIWLAPAPRRPEPSEDQQEAPTDE